MRWARSVLSRFRANRRAPLAQALKTAIAAVAAWLLSGLLIPGPPPIFAAIAAILVVAPSVNQSVGKAVERSAGVLIGVLIAIALGVAFGPNAWVILTAVVVALLVAWVLRATSPTANQVAISAMLVLALGGASSEYAVARVLETLVGAAVGLLVNFVVVPPVLTAPARRDLALLGDEVAASVDRLAEALQHRRTPAELQELMVEARLLRPMRDAAEESLATAEESLELNPRSGRHRGEVAELRALFDRLSPMVTQVIGMTRAFFDHYDDGLADEPTVRAIAEQLRRVAHDVRLLVQSSDAAPEPAPETGPALTAPLVVAAPRSGNWILLGSLMEDLRRMRQELLGED